MGVWQGGGGGRSHDTSEQEGHCAFLPRQQSFGHIGSGIACIIKFFFFFTKNANSYERTFCIIALTLGSYVLKVLKGILDVINKCPKCPVEDKN